MMNEPKLSPTGMPLVPAAQINPMDLKPDVFANRIVQSSANTVQSRPIPEIYLLPGGKRPPFELGMQVLARTRATQEHTDQFKPDADEDDGDSAKLSPGEASDADGYQP